ncbi:MAG: hypothetical protein ABR570_04295 [Burkholderiales bacterium]
MELCEAVRNGTPPDAAELNRILRLDTTHGVLEVQSHTPWHAIAAELRPGDPRARVRTTMATVGESIARNAAGPDGTPAVAHVASISLVSPEGELRRISREREPELFSLTVGGQGLFGTLYSITLRLETLARAVERAKDRYERALEPRVSAGPALELLLPPELVDEYMNEARTRCSDWRMSLCTVALRETAPEADTFLRWARRPYVEVALTLAGAHSLGEEVRSAQLRRELIDAAIHAGGSFQIASTRDATSEQTRACYPELAQFLAHKRRFDPNERLSSGWYAHQRRVLACEPCEVRWGD